MRFCYLLVLLGLALGNLGAMLGSWGWLAGWLGADFVLLGLGYAFDWPRVFGKDRGGRLPAWSRVVFAPLLVYAWAVWRLLRLIEREPPCSEITPHLVIGRRLLPREFPGGFDHVVDLTAEFAEPELLRSASGYMSFPLLDGAAPAAESLQGAVACVGRGKVFVHCAQGHGRSGLFAAALLLHTGAAASSDEALRLIKAVRPGVRLNRAQRHCLDAFAALAC